MQNKVKVLTLQLLCAVLLSNTNCGKVSGAAAALLISDEQEVSMGENFREQIEADTENYPLYRSRPGHNPALLAYVDSIGQAIAGSQSDRPQIEYHFDIIDNDSVINAFAVPGGFIYVYTGLVKESRNEAELAGVIAHEIAHVTKRHGAQQLVRAYGVNMVLDMVVGDSNALRTAMDITTGLAFLKYGRNNEFEADSMAGKYLMDAGVNPRGMQTFLELLALKSSFSVTFLSTHPNTTDRVDAVKRQVDAMPQSVQDRPLPPVKHLP